MGYYGGLVITGSDRFENVGQTVANLGDVNGDGVDDFGIGFRYDNEAYVIFGSDAGLPAGLTTDDIDGTNGYRLTFDAQSIGGFYGSYYNFGSQLVGLGDVNGDGVDDFAVGVLRPDRYYYEDQPSAFVIFGTTADRGEEFTVQADIDVDDGFGIVMPDTTYVDEIEAAGDLNGDGLQDILVSTGVPYYGFDVPLTENGDVILGYAIFGDENVGQNGPVDVEELDGTDGFGVVGGNFYFDGNYFFGEVQPEGILGGFGALGDINGDGFDDIGIQAVDGYAQGGYIYDDQGNYVDSYFNVNIYSQAFVVLGGETPATAAEAPDLVDGENSGIPVFWDDLSGGGVYDNPYDVFYNDSFEIAALGDVNGDGFDDFGFASRNRVLRSELNPESDENASGVMGILFGGPDAVDTDGDGPLDGLNVNMSLAGFTVDENGDPLALSNPPDVMIVNSGPLENGFGTRIEGVGDVNGDGVDDFLITDPGASVDNGNGSTSSYYGEVFLMLGQDSDAGDSFAPIIDLDKLSQGEKDGTFYRIFQDDEGFSGFADNVAAAGDVNGDGFADIIIGQERADVPGAGDSNDGTNAGRAFILFGGEDALEAADNADGANDNDINVENLAVNVTTGALPIIVSVASFGFQSSQFEGDTGATVYTFEVQRTGDLTEGVSFDFAVSGVGFSPANAADFVGGVLPSDTVAFAAGEATATVEIEVQGDTDIEPNEDFVFEITGVSNTGPSDVLIGVSETFAEIRNDDFPAQISIFGTSGLEDSEQVTFQVTRSGDTTSQVSVDFSIVGSSFRPASNNDVQDITVDGVSIGGGLGQTGTITFLPGEDTKDIVITPVADLTVEPDEFINVSLSNLQSADPAEFIRSSSSAAIENDDFDPEILVQGGGSVFEGDAGVRPVVFTIVRRGDTSGEIEVFYDLNPIPAPGDFFAADSNDILGTLPDLTGSVVFGDGVASVDVVVNVTGDTTIEPRESFELRVTDVASNNGVDYDVIVPARTATIINDDGRPPVIPEGIEADVFGDPHIVTLDGLGYDFQAVGDYILVETVLPGDENPFQVQVRFEPLPGSDLVSVTTRMAVNIGDTVVEINALGPDTLLIGGVAVTPEQLALLALDADGDGTADVFFDEALSEFTIILNDLNEALKIKNMDGVLNVCVFLSDDADAGHANNVRGLMGNANGDTTDDLMLRTEPFTVFTDPTFDELYVTYADSWRVQTDERLFTDDEGTGNFPDNFPAAKITIDDLPPAVLAAAEAAVDEAGITDPIIRESAILDFALTGDGDFVQGALGLAADPEVEVDVTDAPDLPLTIGVTPLETTVSEDDGNPNTVGFTFYRIGDTSGDLTIAYAIGGDVDADDFVPGTALTGSVVIADGTSSATLGLGVVNDDMTEMDEALTVSITGSTFGSDDTVDDSGALIAAVSGTTTIETDDFAPDAEDDFFGVNEGETLTGNVLAANPTDADSDPDGDNLTVVAINGQAANVGAFVRLANGGTLRVESDGEFSYIPFDSGKDGDVISETFTYTISDGNGGEDTATATINVDGVESDPTASNFTADVDEDENVSGGQSSYTFDVIALSNAMDADAGDIVSLLSVSNESAAITSIGIDNANEVTLTVAENFFGTVSFDFAVQDQDGGVPANATATINIANVNDGPVAVADEAETDEGQEVSIDVTDNDFDIDSEFLLQSVQAVTDQGGSAEIIDGNITYTPGENFFGEDTFTYTITDGDKTSQATVTVTVNEVDTPPEAEDDTLVTDEDTGGVLGNILENDSDDDDSLVVIAVKDSFGNEVDLTGQVIAGFGVIGISEDGEVGFSPAARLQSLSGVEPTPFEEQTFTYTIEDAGGQTDEGTFTIRVNGLNDDPDAEDDFFAFNSDEVATNLDLLDNDSDLEGQDLTVSLVDTSGLAGTLTDQGGGVFSYDPTAAYADLPLDEEVVETFTYQVSDGAGGVSEIATVQFTITGQFVEDTGPNVVEGTDGRDARIMGTDEDDLIISKGGAIDRMMGNGGADTFVFGEELANGAREYDFILDFEAGVDSIQLDGVADFDLFFTSRYAIILDSNDGDRIYVYGNGLTEEDLGIVTDIPDLVF